MSRRVLATLPLPEPFPTRVSAAAEVTVMGRIPSTADLCDALRADPPDVLCPQLRDPITDEVLAAGGDRLRAVCVMAVGYNNVDVAAATARGIAVGNTPGVLTDATADFTLGLILDAARRISEGDRVMRRRGFTGWEPGYMLGLELRGATLGIVGLGRIGQAVARRAIPFGMKIIATTGGSTALDADLAGAVAVVDLDTLLRTSDVVSLHCPLTDATRHLINEAALRTMKSSAILVNTARGPVVDEAALAEALRDGVIGAAALDVYEREPAFEDALAGLENVVLAPHLGSATVLTRSEMARLTAENALAVLEGNLPVHCVNPQVGASARWATV